MPLRNVPRSRLSPIRSATYRERGRSRMSSGVPACVTRPASTTTMRSARVMASTASWVTIIRGVSSVARCRRRSRRTSTRGRRVERGEGLVQQQEPRFERERASERHPLGLAAGQLRRPQVGQVVQSEPLQPSPGCRQRGGSPRPAAAHAERDVLHDAHPVEEQPILEHDPDRVPRAGTNTAASGSSSNSPSSSMRPASIGCRPARARSNVVLPAPLGPTSTTNSPGATVRVTSSSSRPSSTCTQP